MTENNSYKNEFDAVINILRNHIDNPISGEITLEALRERNIKSIVLWKEHAVPTDYKETDKEIFITIASSLVGVRQGDVIITPAGEKIQVTPELMKNCYEEKFKT